jgi:hypothetical protein
VAFYPGLTLGPLAARPHHQGAALPRPRLPLRPGPPEALVDTEHSDSVERTELEAIDDPAIAPRLSWPSVGGLAIDFRGRQ